MLMLVTRHQPASAMPRTWLQQACTRLPCCSNFVVRVPCCIMLCETESSPHNMLPPRTLGPHSSTQPQHATAARHMQRDPCRAHAAPHTCTAFARAALLLQLELKRTCSAPCPPCRLLGHRQPACNKAGRQLMMSSASALSCANHSYSNRSLTPALSELATQHTLASAPPLAAAAFPLQQLVHLADLVHIVHQVLHGEHEQALPLLSGPAAPVTLQRRMLELGFTTGGQGGERGSDAVPICRGA